MSPIGIMQKSRLTEAHACVRRQQSLLLLPTSKMEQTGQLLIALTKNYLHYTEKHATHSHQATSLLETFRHQCVDCQLRLSSSSYNPKSRFVGAEPCSRHQKSPHNTRLNSGIKTPNPFLE